MKAIRNLISFILPTTVLIIIPLLIEKNFRMGNLWTTVPGFLFICAGLLVIFLTVKMFIQIGKGTLAPWDPTRKLVTGGLYGYVRNPMILGVCTTLVGEAVLFRSLHIGIWAGAFFTINHIYFILSEEPGLEKRFGEEYREYKRNVSRWMPGVSVWKPGQID